jgi:hypothetical protein
LCSVFAREQLLAKKRSLGASRALKPVRRFKSFLLYFLSIVKNYTFLRVKSPMYCTAVKVEMGVCRASEPSMKKNLRTSSKSLALKAG